ncbi:MAG: hypothetical protein WDW36_000154 [Sanguina aurantia]
MSGPLQFGSSSSSSSSSELAHQPPAHTTRADIATDHTGGGGGRVAGAHAREPRNAAATEQCWEALKGAVHQLLCLKGDQNFFLFSVNEEFDKAPGYYALITDPQDLATIYNRLDQQEYARPGCVFQTPYDVHRAMLQVGAGCGTRAQRARAHAPTHPGKTHTATPTPTHMPTTDTDTRRRARARARASVPARSLRDPCSRPHSDVDPPRVRQPGGPACLPSPHRD